MIKGIIKGIKGFVFNTDFKERYYRCQCGELLADEDFANGRHAGHKSQYALYISFTEFLWIRWREFKKYTLAEWRKKWKI